MSVIKFSVAEFVDIASTIRYDTVLLTIPLRELGSVKTAQIIRRMSICVTCAIENGARNIRLR
jgi:hypothetical protein